MTILLYNNDMKTYRLHTPAPAETNPLILEDVALPQPGPGRVRTKAALWGIRHTDLHPADLTLVPLVGAAANVPTLLTVNELVVRGNLPAATQDIERRLTT